MVVSDLVETLTTLQESIFLGAVVCRNRIERRRTGERNFLFGQQTTGDAVFPGYPNDRRRPANTGRGPGCPTKRD
jgi:hypothetical protein